MSGAPPAPSQIGTELLTSIPIELRSHNPGHHSYDVCNGDDMGKAEKGPNRTAATTTLRDIRRVQMNRDGRHGVTTLTKPSDSYSPHPQLKGALNDFICGGQSAMDKWLADPAVVAALHVKADTGRMHYRQSAGDLTALYKKLVAKYRVVIFSGDVDACVPYWGSEKFTRSIGGTVKKTWHAWTSNSIEDKGSVVAGYAIGYEDFQFVTVKGAGHMVATFKPRFALTAFKKFLANEPF